MNPLNNFTQNQNPMQMINQFMNFAKNFQGNPEQEIQNLVNSGQLDQGRLNQLTGQARQIQEMLKTFGINL